MASKTSIANLALVRIGVSRLINNVDSDKAQEAIAVRTIWDNARRYVLRDFPWPFATQYQALALVAGSASVNAAPDWRYAYRYPSDCMYARRLAVESVGRVNPTPPPFRIGRDSQGKLIYTNEADAVLEYTVDITNTQEFDDIFDSQLAWKLGADLAPPLSRVKGMAETCMGMYEVDKTKAASRALNESQQETAPESEFIRARE